MLAPSKSAAYQWLEGLIRRGEGRLSDRSKDSDISQLRDWQDEASHCLLRLGSAVEHIRRDFAELKFTNLFAANPSLDRRAADDYNYGTLTEALKLLEDAQYVFRAGEGAGLNRPEPEQLKETACEASDQELPKVLRRGKHCDQVIKEVRQIKFMHAERGMTAAEIRTEHSGFAVWNVAKDLSEEDRDVFEHPNRWGPVVGYAKSLLAKHYGRSQSTITDWVKAYRSMRDRKSRVK